MNNELYHWKYISRKKVGNKWQYEYAKDSTKGTNTRPSANTTSKYGQANNWKYLGREKVDGKLQYTYDRPESTTEAPKKKGKVSQYIEGVKKDIAESKERAAKNNTSVTKEYVKDRLGYDELERYKDAQRIANKAAANAEGYKEYADKEFDNSIYYNPETDKHEYKSEGYREHMWEVWETLRNKEDTADGTQKRARKALDEFFDTPIGKIDKIDAKIDRARTKVADWLEDTADSTARWLKRRNKQTGFIR